MNYLLLLIILVMVTHLFKKTKGKKKYRIVKGKSYSYAKPTLHLGSKEITGEILLTKESTYPPHDSPQINKLTGIAWGYHRWQSLRIGEMCDSEGNMTLYAYGYVKWKRFYFPLTTVNMPTKIKYRLGYKNGKMYMVIYGNNNELLSNWDMFCDVTVLPGYYNNFYHENATGDVEIIGEVR